MPVSAQHCGQSKLPEKGAKRLVTQRAPGACLGHEPGDNKGQQRYRASSSDLTLTSGNAQEQQRLWGHAVYGMQGVRGSNPLSSTRHNASAGLPLRAICQQIVSRSPGVSAITLSALTGLGASQRARQSPMPYGRHSTERKGRGLVPAIDYRASRDRTRTGLRSGVACGRSHSDEVVGSTVWSTTLSRSAVKVSRSTWSRSRTLNASIVRAAS